MFTVIHRILELGRASLLTPVVFLCFIWFAYSLFVWFVVVFLIIYLVWSLFVFLFPLFDSSAGTLTQRVSIHLGKPNPVSLSYRVTVTCDELMGKENNNKTFV